jgi:hypothetical protein
MLMGPSCPQAHMNVTEMRKLISQVEIRTTLDF